MRQVRLDAEKKLNIFEVEKPEVEDGWVRIKTLRCGVCGTDAHSYLGETIFGKVFPFHIGHEVCGIIEEKGACTNGLQVGDLVVINPFFTCNGCSACYMDRSNNCQNKTTIGLKGPGGYSEYICAPATSVYKAKPDSDVNRLCLAEPVANVIYAMDKLKIDCSMNVLINGVGAIGLMFLQLVMGKNPNTIAVSDFNKTKLEKAETLGADIIYTPDQIPEDAEFDVIIDCTGSVKCIATSIHRLAFGGQYMSFGVCPIDGKVDISPFELYKKDATFISSFALNKSSMQKAVNLLEGTRFNTDILIDSIRGVEDLEESLILMAEGATQGKIIIDTTK